MGNDPCNRIDPSGTSGLDPGQQIELFNFGLDVWKSLNEGAHAGDPPVPYKDAFDPDNPFDPTNPFRVHPWHLHLNPCDHS